MAYVHKHYPSFRYHPKLAAKVVRTEEEDNALTEKDEAWGDTPYDNNFPQGNPDLAVQDTPERQKLKDKGALEHNPSEKEIPLTDEEVAAEVARKRKDAEKAQKEADKAAKKAAARKK